MEKHAYCFLLQIICIFFACFVTGRNECSHSYNGRCRPNYLLCEGIVVSVQNLCCPKKQCCVDLEGCEKDICNRTCWNATDPVNNATSLNVPVDFVFIQHTVTSPCYTKEECSAKIRSIQSVHINNNGWDDIGYNFVIGEDGNVYEGRGWDGQGAHTLGWNDLSLGIAFIGNFNDVLPNEKALFALKKLLACGEKIGKITNDYKLYGHRDVRPTISPGDALYNYLTTLENFGPLPPMKP